MKNLIDGCFERLVADIDAFGGRVDKIIGDAIVALFGAPTAHEDDAERAVRAALRMQETLAAHTAELDVDIRMRVGVNTGEVLVGALRAGGDYTAMGDVVNTANRLQAAAQPGEVLVGTATFAATRRTVRYDALEPIDAKGREELVPAWRAEAAVAPPGYRPERNRRPAHRSRAGARAPVPQRRERRSATRGRRCCSCSARPGSASRAWPRSWRSHAEETHNALILEGRCVPYGEANVWWPVADALRHGAGIRSSDPADKAIELARTSVCIALGEDASSAEVDRVHQGLLYLMGYESELRAIDPARAREEATSAVVTYAERFSAAPSRGGRAVRPALGRRPRARARRHAARPARRAGGSWCWPPPARRWRSGGTRPTAATTSSCSPSTRSRSDVGRGAALRAGRRRPRRRARPRSSSTAAAATRSSSRSSSPSSSDAGMVGAPGHPDHEDHVELPDTLRGLVAARLDGLTADERRVLDDCAVLGRRGPMMAIEVMAGKHLGIDDVRPVLESLEAKELLVLSGDGRGREVDLPLRPRAGGRLQHAHQGRPGPVPLRHRVVDGGARGHRARRRRRPDHLPLRPGRRAHPRARPGRRPAERPHRAGPALARAGGRPRQPGRDHRSWPSASTARASGCSAGSTAPSTAPSSPGGPGPWPGSARSHRRAPTPWRPSRRAGRAATDALPRPRRARSWCSPTSSRRRRAGRRPRTPLDEAGRVFAALGDASGEAEVLRFRGFGALTRHEYAAATELLEQALARYEALDDRRGVAWVRQNLAWCAFYSGRAEEAEALLHKAAATFEEIGDQGGLGWARGPAGVGPLPAGPLGRGGRDGRGDPRRRPPRRRPVGHRHDADPRRLRAALDRPHR